MAVRRWTFYSPKISETFTLEINPHEGGDPIYSRNVTYQNRTGPASTPLVFEGGKKSNEMTATGTIHSEAQFNLLKFFYNSNDIYQVTDDLGRQFWIWVSEFAPKRVRKASNPWYHTYTLKYTEVL